jgi:hypothetical protein
MKIMLTKKGMTRPCPPEQLEQMKAAGWSETKVSSQPVVAKELSDDVIVVRQPVKSKNTVKNQDDAINKGDE